MTNSDNELPPTHEVVFDPNSPEFHNKIFEALGLDTEKYGHVNPDILAKFKDIICKYSATFWLPGVNLQVIKGAEHQISTQRRESVVYSSISQEPLRIVCNKIQNRTHAQDEYY